MHWGFKIIIWLLLIWSGYHIIRDVFQDLLNIHNPIVDIWHVAPKRDFSFLGSHYKLIGFIIGLLPLVGIFILSIKSLISNKFGWKGSTAVGLFASYIIFWLWLIS